MIGSGGKYGTNRYVHRVAYEEVHGPIPESLTIDHLCRNRLCVNPAHLEAVTHTENVRRGRAAKLTVEAARSIRAALAAGVDRRELAEMHGVDVSMISRISTGASWAGA